MLSLPLIPPPEDQSTWLRSTFRPRAESPPPHNTSGNPNAQQHRQQRQQQQRDEEKKQQQARSPLAMLASDEAAIAKSKAAIRNFGAYWIRPPGVSKTLQAMIEEDAERREQEELERQERGLLDLQAQQQLEEAQQRAADTAAEQEGHEDEDRDLDDEIPEADAEATFNEDSMLEGSQLQQEQEQYEELEEAELTGVARDEEDLGLEHERDLDDSVPEAGSYQHTDTELEDSSSEDDTQESFAAPSARRSGSERSSQVHPESSSQGPRSARRRLDNAVTFDDRPQLFNQAHLPSTLLRSPGAVDLSSPQLESSFADSSPVRQRANRDGRGGFRQPRF